MTMKEIQALAASLRNIEAEKAANLAFREATKNLTKKERAAIKRKYDDAWSDAIYAGDDNETAITKAIKAVA